MYTVLLPPGVNQIAVNKYIISYQNWKEYVQNVDECRLALLVLQCHPTRRSGVGRPKQKCKDQEHLQGLGKEVSLDLFGNGS